MRRFLILASAVLWVFFALRASVVFGQGTSELVERVSSTEILAVFGTALMLAVLLARIVEKLVEYVLPKKTDPSFEIMRDENRTQHAQLVRMMKEMIHTQKMEDDAHRQITQNLRQIAEINNEVLSQMSKVAGLLDAMITSARLGGSK